MEYIRLFTYVGKIKSVGTLVISTYTNWFSFLFYKSKQNNADLTSG